MDPKPCSPWPIELREHREWDSFCLKPEHLILTSDTFSYKEIGALKSELFAIVSPDSGSSSQQSSYLTLTGKLLSQFRHFSLGHMRRRLLLLQPAWGQNVDTYIIQGFQGITKLFQQSEVAPNSRKEPTNHNFKLQLKSEKKAQIWKKNAPILSCSLVYHVQLNDSKSPELHFSSKSLRHKSRQCSHQFSLSKIMLRRSR